MGGRYLSTVTTALSTNRSPRTSTTYTPAGSHGYPLADLLLPLRQTAVFCGMRYLPPLAVQGGGQVSEAEIAAQARTYRETVHAYLETPA